MLLLFTMAETSLFSQCILHISGMVYRTDKTEGLSGATVEISGLTRAVITDSSGRFIINNLCRGTYDISISSVGFESTKIRIRLLYDTSIQCKLISDTGQLSAVEVTAEKKQDISTNARSDLKGIELFQTAGQTLSGSLQNIPGINAIQTGPTISKPVIHGLHSNRILILNNGVRQEGQQWGTEHAPEIDPFIANRVTIIKGAASVRYGSDAISGVILVELAILAPEKPLEGEVNLVAGTNGQMGAGSGLLQGTIKNLGGINWRVQGSLKKAGNFRTPDYYLANTGFQEADFSFAANYHNKEGNFGLDAYYSQYHNTLGIFAGSHVGNVSDLDSAFARPKPITPSYFTYDIARTYQVVNHDLLKLNGYYLFKNTGHLEVQFSNQKNKRDEYDIDYPYSTDPNVLNMPQISFQIQTQELDLVYHLPVKNDFSGMIGLTGYTQGNVFRGIRYLVPNFRNYNGGAFWIERYTKNKLTLEAGLRFDYRWLRVYQINNTSLQTYHTTMTYQNPSGTVGASYRVNNKLSFSANVGSAFRAPSVNELYINGIHLSAASYEKGDSTLKSERSYDFTVSGRYEVDRFFAELVIYDNIINNYIYAKPSLTPITLISGTYPLFNYTQANATIKGFDLEVNFKITKKLTYDGKASIVRGWNKSINDWLIFMPADRYVNNLRYDFGKWGITTNWYANVGFLTVLKQTRTPPNSDYVPPPPGYNLINANLGFQFPIRKTTANIELASTNLANTVYRDYLNRYRYYADDLGRDVVLRFKLNF
jgi:iron complex outermembrane recepter protein